MNCVKVLCNCYEKKLNLKIASRLRKQKKFCTFSQEKVNFYVSNSEMQETFHPPESIRGMKVLDRTAFKKTIRVPFLTVGNKVVNASLKLLKNHSLKIKSYKGIQEVGNDRVILLDPEKVQSWNDFQEDLQDKLKKLNVHEDNLSETIIELGYENWSANDLLKAILPKDQPISSSYSYIGHIIHLNLKEHLLDYKNIIAEVLLDKVRTAKTVVCKKNIIDNTYRTFDMEVLCGDPNFLVSTRENNCIFEFDFSKVYWNPRLSTEHARIIQKIDYKDVVFDIFAGVGPFAIPAAKKQSMVYANDLNPESFKWLNHNIGLNKRCKSYIKTYNKDGGDFIMNDVREELLKICQDELFSGNVHVIMNLPCLAPRFIKHFRNLIKESDLKNGGVEQTWSLIVHCYFFNKKENDREMFERESGMNLDGIEHKFTSVRAVSNSKEMHKITLSLPRDYLFEKSVATDTGEPSLKRPRTD